MPKRFHAAILPMVAAFGLSGCLGSGGGGGAGIGGGAAPAPGPGGGAFATELARVQALNPTTNMPTAINATYTGQAQADLSDGGAPVGQATADLNLALNWTDGGPAANVWSGNASNLRGTVGGTTFTSTGTIPVNGATSGVTRTPAAGVAVGGMMVNLAGNVDIDDGSGPETRNVGMQLGGNFYGNNAVAMTGSASMTIFSGPIIGGTTGDLVGAGQFYAEQ